MASYISRLPTVQISINRISEIFLSHKTSLKSQNPYTAQYLHGQKESDIEGEKQASKQHKCLYLNMKHQDF